MIAPLSRRIAGAAVVVALTVSTAHAITLPAEFGIESATPGASFVVPTSIAFLPGGRMLVTEKRGRVYSVVNGVKSSTPMWSGEAEVLDSNDRGLLNIAVDPDYLVNHYVYLLYTVDPDSDLSDGNVLSFGRLTRYTVSATDSNQFDPASRTILLGVDWTHGPLEGSPSHTVGCLQFGRDGSLLVTAGDGADFNQVDAGGLYPAAFGPGLTDPNEDIGAFRAQDITSLCGKVLRINPANGHGYPSNPYYDGDETSVRSKVWAYGFRNPYRFAVRPGTGSTDPADGQPGTIYLGDVGWDTWEEFDVVRPGMNYGWPCIEGPAPQTGYQAATPAHNGCGSVGSATNPAPYTAPLIYFNHSNGTVSYPQGYVANTATGGTWYTGTLYPPAYRNKLFVADYGQSWIGMIDTDSTDAYVGFSLFATQADGPVDLVADPVSGDLFYVSINTGEVRRIRFFGTTGGTPYAQATASRTFGTVPLTVDFSSDGSYDPEGGPLAFEWTFGDGYGSTEANPQHTYTLAGDYKAVLTATDTTGLFAQDTVAIQAVQHTDFPSTGVLDDFNRPDGAVGGAWVDGTASFAISNQELELVQLTGSMVWSGAVFGPSQEAYVTFSAIDPATQEQNLMLKVQGPSWVDGHIEVRYDPRVPGVYVSTYAPVGGWVAWAGPIPVTFQPGDQFGARALADGTVEVYRNGAMLSSVSVAGWPYATFGGSLGMTVTAAYTGRFDDFGGGDVVFTTNTPPVATILAPADGSFYTDHEVVQCSGQASDAEDPLSALTRTWEVILHHNTHIHPDTPVQGDTTSFVTENHDDGTGVWYELRYIVTDSQDAKDSTSVLIWPDNDLTASGVSTLPITPGTTTDTQCGFRIRNSGDLPTRSSTWVLVGDGAVLDSGQVIVPAHDSVGVSVTVPAGTFSAGDHLLRVVADTNAVVRETDETNNASLTTITVETGPGSDDFPPVFTDGPSADPTDVMALVSWRTDEPSTGAVRYGLTLSLGDSVTAPQDTVHVAELDGLTASTQYYFVVAATDTLGHTAVTPPDSFTTLSGPLAVEPPPRVLALSPPMPNPTTGGLALSLSLPSAARVGFAIHDIMGREVWNGDPGPLGAGRWTLRWPGVSRGGSRLGPGVYLARVTVNGKAFVRRFVLLR